MPARLGLAVGGEPPFETATRCVELSVMAEKDGYDSVWMPDHLVDLKGSMADPWTTFGYIAALTRNIRLYTSVTDYQKIHPSKLSQTIATLAELSAGRVSLGIGTGEAMNLLPFGLPLERPHVRIERLEEYIGVLRSLWSSTPESPATYEGRHYRLKEAWIDQKMSRGDSRRIFLGALGSTEMLKLVGRCGDGWVPWYITPEMFKVKLDVVRGAAREAGRDPDAIECTYMVPVVAASDPRLVEKAMSDFKMAIMTLCRYLVTAEGVKVPTPRTEINFQRLIASDKSLEEISRLSDYVSDSLVHRVCAIGGPEEIIRFLEDRVKIGATHLILKLSKGIPEENLRVMRETVIPYFKDSRDR